MERHLNYKLNLTRKFGYICGHIYLELAAALFMNYLTVYAKVGLDIDPGIGGYYFIFAHFVDAVVNPIFGLLSDRFACAFFGKRKTWILIGNIITPVVNMLTFSNVFDNPHLAVHERFWVLSPMAMLFGACYAVTSVTHLSLLTELSSDETDRLQMTGWRNATTVVCNVFVYVVAWIFLSLSTGDNDTSQLTKAHAYVFSKITYVIFGIGGLTNVIFQILVPESQQRACGCMNIGIVEDVRNRPTVEKQTTENDGGFRGIPGVFTLPYDHVTSKSVNDADMTQGTPHNRIQWLKHLLKSPKFYKVTIVYTCARIAMVSSQFYMPLYVSDGLEMDKVSIALLPLLVFISSFISSLLIKKIFLKLGQYKTFILGETAMIGACTWIFLISSDSYQQIYGAGVLYGFGLAVINVISTEMITELIGQHVENGSAVFGLVSFIEKMIGVVVFALLQYSSPCLVVSTSECRQFYRTVMMAVPGGATLFAFGVVGTKELYDKVKSNTSNKVTITRKAAVSKCYDDENKVDERKTDNLSDVFF